MRNGDTEMLQALGVMLGKTRRIPIGNPCIYSNIACMLSRGQQICVCVSMRCWEDLAENFDKKLFQACSRQRQINNLLVIPSKTCPKITPYTLLYLVRYLILSSSLVGGERSA